MPPRLNAYSQVVCARPSVFLAAQGPQSFKSLAAQGLMADHVQ